VEVYSFAVEPENERNSEFVAEPGTGEHFQRHRDDSTESRQLGVDFTTYEIVCK